MKLSERIKPISYLKAHTPSLVMLKLLAQSQNSFEAGKHKPLKKAFTDLAARTKDLP